MSACLEANAVDTALTMLENAQRLEWPLPSDTFMGYFNRRVEEL